MTQKAVTLEFWEWMRVIYSLGHAAGALSRSWPEDGNLRRQIELVSRIAGDIERQIWPGVALPTLEANRMLPTTPLRECSLSNRVINALESAEFITLGDILTKREDELLEARNFGEGCLTELKAFLSNHGLELQRSR